METEAILTLSLSILSAIVSLGTCIYVKVTVRGKTEHTTGVVITKELVKEEVDSAELNKIKNKYNDKGDDGKKQGHHEIIHDKITYEINFSDIGLFEEKINTKKNGNQNNAFDQTPKSQGMGFMSNINILKPIVENEVKASTPKGKDDTKIDFLAPQQVFEQNQKFSNNAEDHRVTVLDRILEGINVSHIGTPKHHIDLSGNEHNYDQA